MDELSSSQAGQLSEAEIRAKIAARSWWHQIEVAPGIITPGRKDTFAELNSGRLGLPERLDGQSVLDIGSAEGFYAFECERRGAQVTAADRLNAEASGFGLVRDLLGSRAKHVHCSVYNLDPEQLGQFDLVLFLGVIYHLRYPLLALDVLHSLCKNSMILESQICDRRFVRANGKVTTLKKLSREMVNLPIAQFFPGDELNGDVTNWWVPNQLGLIKMLESSGFKSRVHFSDGDRIVLHCQKVARTTPAQQWADEESASVKRPSIR